MYFLTVFLVMLGALHIPTDPTDITDTDRAEVPRKLISHACLVKN